MRLIPAKASRGQNYSLGDYIIIYNYYEKDNIHFLNGKKIT